MGALLLVGGLAGLLFYFGVPLLIRMAVFMSSIRDVPPQGKETKTTFAAPVLDALPDATPSAQIMVTGYSLPNTTLSISVNGETKQSDVSREDGSFSVPISLTEGENVIVARARDDQQNESSPSISWIVIRDSQPPTLTITTPSDHSQRVGDDQKTVAIEGKTDSGSTISVNGRLVSVMATGQFSLMIDLHEGDNTVTIVAADKAGNRTTSTLTIQWKPG